MGMVNRISIVLRQAAGSSMSQHVTPGRWESAFIENSDG
jgi:hypothetical protein